ncbi:MAG: 4Fe-4S dicluster domain-containing protein [Pirellulales bacterium]|nr:4Fe-4S dicluster domain-containing protein [Pirellulales bacterium]
MPRSGLEDLFQILQSDGYQVLGPTVVNDTVMIRPLESIAQLPQGVSDRQDGGFYRLVDGDPELSFEFVVGPNGPKNYLFPAKLKLLEFHVGNERFELDAGQPDVPKYAFLGVRPCELAAVKVQDRVFGVAEPGMFRCESETWYTLARRQALFIAVNCTRPAGTCFCASWGTGPRATEGFDLALTELRGGFIVEVGSDRGQAIVGRLPTREPTVSELELAELKLERAAEQMGRRLETGDVKELLDHDLEHPEWDKVAQRCLSCGNCTMVCPTCFCCTVEDSTYLADENITRTRYWESCFTHQFSYLTSGPERATIRGRYRHWLRHKLSTWWDQFDMSGCVGCGRCITWCPVGIDLTEEIPRFREGGHAKAENTTQSRGT